MNKVEVVVVTGMSGAGKTSAMACFENLAFRCIDNYPVALMEQFGLEIKDNSQYTRIAMAVMLDDAIRAVRQLQNMDWIQLSVVFLDASDEVLLKRYKETRRSHPLLISSKVSSLSDAIDFDRVNSSEVAKLANITIDTTNLKNHVFSNIIENYFIREHLNPFRVSFVSFGYKHGIPKDADLLFDVRFLPNPFYIASLRNGTGNDEDVYNYVMEKNETIEFATRIESLLDYLLVQYQNEGKMHLIIGIGCTGGQHRSVSLVNYFSKLYEKKYQVYCLHRDAVNKR